MTRGRRDIVQAQPIQDPDRRGMQPLAGQSPGGPGVPFQQEDAGPAAGEGERSHASDGPGTDHRRIDDPVERSCARATSPR
jgi:hypothetical protein